MKESKSLVGLVVVGIEVVIIQIIDAVKET